MISGLVQNLGILVMIGTVIFAGIVTGVYYLVNRKSEHNLETEKIRIEPKRRVR